MAAIVLAGKRGIAMASLSPSAAALAAVAGLIPAAVAAYGVALWVLRIEGRAEISAVLARLPLAGRFFRRGL
jgi:putative peptidoglycan lipid II flippase